MNIDYIPDAFRNLCDLSALVARTLPWLDRTEARRECFMSPIPRVYTYGQGRGIRTYRSVEETSFVRGIRESLPGEPNVCFLNFYANDHKALGWHSDDSPDTFHEHPISVVSFGVPREIVVRPKGHKGPIPDDWRWLLEPGSLFIMPPGFQQTHEHRIPKGSRAMDWRMSLTFRHML